MTVCVLHATADCATPPGSARLMADRMIHMAATTRTSWLHDRWMAVCRCGWQSPELDGQGDARHAGDAHLAEANHDD